MIDLDYRDGPFANSPKPKSITVYHMEDKNAAAKIAGDYEYSKAEIARLANRIISGIKYMKNKKLF